jgi:two-component system, sensor histidine kinase YesM
VAAMVNKNLIKCFLRATADVLKTNMLLYPKSLRKKITILVTLTLLVPIILSGIYLYYFIYNNILTQNLNKELNHSIQSLGNTLIPKYRIIENSFDLFQSNQAIHIDLEQINPQDQTYYIKAKRNLNMETQLKYSVVNDYAWNSKLLKSVVVYKNQENFFYLLHNYLPDDRIIGDYIKYIRNYENSKIETTAIELSENFNTIYLIRDIENIITRQTIGKLALGIDETALLDEYNSVIPYSDWKAYIFDSEGKIYFHNDTSLIGKSANPELIHIAEGATTNIKEFTTNSEEYFVLSEKIPDMNMTSVIMAPKKALTLKIKDITSYYLYLIIMIVLIALVISAFVIANVTKPLNDIAENIQEVYTGNFTSKMPTYKYSELNQVSITFNEMIDKIQYLFNEVYQKQILLTESELKALHSQINPHFLFNVLEVISWEARMSKNDKIYKMINSLGQLLRANITMSSREKITSKQELEYIEFYLYLQKMRFGDKININISIPDKTLLDFYLPKLSIQPIVENAIIHGLENKRGSGNLNINILNLNNFIQFEITDDGVGFDASSIDLNTEITTEYLNGGRSHIGIINVQKRIRLIYGDSYGLTIQSKFNEGTKVLVNIPYDRGVI